VAGTIVSHTGNKLLIQLPGDAGTIEGVVTDDTEIKCETEDEHEDDDSPAKASRDGADDSPGDDHGTKPESDDDEPSKTEPDDDEKEADDDPGSKHEHDGDEDNRCGIADLTPGTLVHEAELKVTSAGAVFEEIELIK
jgi:hypothetical protein